MSSFKLCTWFKLGPLESIFSVTCWLEEIQQKDLENLREVLHSRWTLLPYSVSRIEKGLETRGAGATFTSFNCRGLQCTHVHFNYPPRSPSVNGQAGFCKCSCDQSHPKTDGRTEKIIMTHSPLFHSTYKGTYPKGSHLQLSNIGWD